MRPTGAVGAACAALGLAASLACSHPQYPALGYPDVMRAAAGVLVAYAFASLQRQLGRLARQPAWGRGWELARAGCWAVAGAGGLLALRPVLIAETAPALAAGGLVLAAGLGLVAFDLRRLGGGSG